MAVQPSIGSESSLSSWAAPYVTDMLGQAQAISSQPYAAYEGPLTAGASPLQQQAFAGIAGLALPSQLTTAASGAGQAGQAALQRSLAAVSGFNPNAALQQAMQAAAGTGGGAMSGVLSDIRGFTTPGALQSAATAAGQQGSQELRQTLGGVSNLTAPDMLQQAGQAAIEFAQNAGGMTYDPNTFQGGIFGTAEAQQYMNPYLQAALQPQLEEARRQAAISRLGEAGRLTQAGAFGGSRQAIMESEGDRNLQTSLSDITGTGYANAYQQAMQQFNADQARRLEAEGMGEESSQFGARFGLDALGKQLEGIGMQADVGKSMGDFDIRRLGLEADIGKSLEDAALRRISTQADIGTSMGEMDLRRLGLQSDASRSAGDLDIRSASLQGELGRSANEAALRQMGLQADAARAMGDLDLRQAGLQADVGRAMADFNLRNLSTMSDMGGIQRGIESQGIAADYAQFQQERDYPTQQLQFMQSMLQGLPLEAQSTVYADPSTIESILGGAGGGTALGDLLNEIADVLR
jgi:hypothetical protein